MNDFIMLIDNQRKRFETFLESWLARFACPVGIFNDSCRYSLTIGGKRLRPILVLFGGDLGNVPDETILPLALAVELIHTYSLIHDDLPALDNDDLRRGKPTNHLVFGEANAILAGNVLLTEAFALIARKKSGLSTLQSLDILRRTCAAVGIDGLLGGQAMDINPIPKTDRFAYLETLHKGKTGALITLSIVIGAVAAGLDDTEIGHLEDYGRSIGLAFQIKDDLLDHAVEADLGKLTYPGLLGIDEAERRARTCVDTAIAALHSFNDRADPLRSLARYTIERSF